MGIVIVKEWTRIQGSKICAILQKVELCIPHSNEGEERCVSSQILMANDISSIEELHLTSRGSYITKYVAINMRCMGTR